MNQTEKKGRITKPLSVIKIDSILSEIDSDQQMNIVQLFQALKARSISREDMLEWACFYEATVITDMDEDKTLGKINEKQIDYEKILDKVFKN